LKKNATKFCSFKCNKEYEYKEYIKRWLNNEATGTIGTKPKPECGISDKWNGKKLVLEIDHINGNRGNNTFENLRVLCPNCHSQTGTFRNKPRSDR
jgi:5-methylcytosine-specific restriction endonuclease McrA